MRKKLIPIVLLLALAISSVINAQDLKFAQVSEAELTKDTKDGRYAGTFLNGDKIDVYYLVSTIKEGVQLKTYSFDNALSFQSAGDRFVDDAQATEEFAWYLPKEKVEKTASPSDKYIAAGRAFGGGMKFQLGTIKKEYYLGIYTGMNFNEEKELKAKAGDIWRIIPSGFKATSDYDVLATDNGFYKELDKYGNPLVAKADKPVLAAGTITEKVKMKGPWTSAGNRVAIVAVDAMNFENSRYNIYPLPYTAMSMGSGLGQDDNLTSLFAPLNGPTNVKELQHFLWKDKKDIFSVMRFNDNYEMVDSVFFRSKLMWGQFQILNGQGSTFVTGMGKQDFDGWARNEGMMVKKIDCIQVTEVRDGKLVFSKLYDEDLLKSKMVVPKGEKTKFSLRVEPNEYKEVIPIPGGDRILLGQSQNETYGMQIDPFGELKAFYYLGRIDGEKSAQYNYQVMFKGDDMYLVINEQPYEFTNDAQISTSTSKFSGAYVSTTVTTTTVTKMNQVFLQSKVVRINTKTQEMSNELLIDGKDFYAQGSFPAMFTKDAIYFTGRAKGPKGKQISIARIDL